MNYDTIAKVSYLNYILGKGVHPSKKAQNVQEGSRFAREYRVAHPKKKLMTR